MDFLPRRALVLTALDVEYEAVRAHLRNLREEEDSLGTVYEVGECGQTESPWTMCLSEVGAGNVAAATQVERALQHWSPEVALFVGVAGGIKDVTIGDVVAATKIYGYESGKDTGNGFVPRPEVGNSSYRLVNRARAEARRDLWYTNIREFNPSFAPQAFVGPIAAGEKVVASSTSEIATFLRRYYSDALAVEMEGAGFLRALHAHQGINALVVRGISDLLSDKARTDSADSQKIASRHAAGFAVTVLEQLKATTGRVVEITSGPDLSHSFADLCKLLWPIVEENKRIFTHFGPNSGADKENKQTIVRHDLSLWYSYRPKLVDNNDKISKNIHDFADVIPDAFRDIFDRWLSHIDAFKAHVKDGRIDYREHQFPVSVIYVIKSNM